MATETKNTTKAASAKTASKSAAKSAEKTKSTLKKTTSTKSSAASKPAAVKTGTSKARSKKSTGKKTKAPKWFSVLVGIAVLIYAGYYAYTHKEELYAQFFAPDTVTTEQTVNQKVTNGAEQTAAETKAPVKADVKPAEKKIVPGEKGFSFDGDLGYTENNPLYFGNPSDAISDVNSNVNYLMVKDQYTLSYNSELLIPNWVAWHLCKSDMGESDRMDDFRPDDELPADWYKVKKADYQYNDYGYDRGHVCPSADRTKTKTDNSMTFLMTNMMPQTPDNNRVIWMHFENFERELVNQGNEVYIIAGPYGQGGTSAKGKFDEIPIKLKNGETLSMRVPSHTWKVLIAIPDGKDDLARVTKDTTVIAINVPNEMGIAKNGDWEQYLCSIDDIEEMTGYDFFELLPDDVENVLESEVYVR